MSADLSSIFSIGVDILSAFRDSVTNSTLFQTGDVISGVVESDRVQTMQHVGLVTLPSNPVVGQAACQGIVIKRGDNDVCIATRDLRGQALAGNMAAGETCIYGGGKDGNAQGRVMIKADGSITMMTTDTNVANGKTVALGISPTQFAFSAPWGSLKFDASGLHIKTKAGPRLDMGGISIAGLPGAIASAFTSYFKLGSSGPIKLDAPNVFVGAGQKHTPALTTAASPSPTAIADAINAFAGTVGTAVAAISGATPADLTAAAKAAGATIGSASSALSAALKATPTTQSNSVLVSP